MFIENVKKLKPDAFVDPDLYLELMAIENDLDRQKHIATMRNKAKELGSTKIFDGMLSAAQRDYKKECKEIAKKEKAERIERELMPGHYGGNNASEFSLLDPSDQYDVGEWKADNNGVRRYTDRGVEWACTQPIFVSRILKNAETGNYKVEIKFLFKGRETTIYVPREAISSKAKITGLSAQGVNVTDNSAKALVQYLADVQALNENRIPEVLSTSRLGWIDNVDAAGNKEKTFLPYKADVVFDNESSVKSLFESMKSQGKAETWYKHIRELRANKDPEVLINLAASFASVLVEPCNALPFIVSLWGGTGIGKTVLLKVCTSVWADPGEGKYITDAKATTTAMEIRLNVLNSLPMTLDDMAQISRQDDEDFSQIIYRWCAGKGRDRSNKELGLNKLTSWRNCTITNGERSMVDESSQGGAINRVIDIEASGKILFDGKSGNKTTKIVEKNFGHAGKEFIDILLDMGFESINFLYNQRYEELKAAAAELGVEKEEKQLVPMALILTADRLIEEHLFKDGVLIDIHQCLGYLRNKGDVSEDERAYTYLMDVIAENRFRFEEEHDNSAQYEAKWGFWKSDNQVAIIGSRFDQIIRDGKFQAKAFLSWCKKNDLIECDERGTPKKVVKRNGKTFRAVVIRTDYYTPDEIEDTDEMDDFKQLPFR